MALTYGTEQQLTITLASLATSASRVAGRASTAIQNSSGWLDAILSGFTTTGSSPSSYGVIDLFLYAQANDTPTYPGGHGGTDAGLTWASVTQRDVALRHVQTITIENGPSSNVTYYFEPVRVGALFGFMPKRIGAFLAHSTGVNLHATAGNHGLFLLPITAF